jgi:actin-related protein
MRKNRSCGWETRDFKDRNYSSIPRIQVSWRPRSVSAIQLIAGLNQSGLADTIAEIIAEMPEELRGMYWANIGILGGLGYIEALGERL